MRGDNDKTKVYASFLTNVSEFGRLNQLPVPLKFGEDIHVEQLVAHEAKWHKTCHLKFNDTKLHRTRKREGDKDSDSTARQNQPLLQCQPLDKSKCIFCPQDDGHLHKYRTFDADSNMRRIHGYRFTGHSTTN